MSVALRQQVAAIQPAANDEGFLGSFALFASLVMTTFVVAILFAIIGLTQPAWLGFN
jgi:hypothetical protein